MMIYPSDFIYQHQYHIKGLSSDYKQLIKNCKSKKIDLGVIHDKYKIALNFSFPGFIFNDSFLAERYSKELYTDFLKNVHTPPRGYIGKDAIIIVGIAPSLSEYSFGESSWLFGPSVYILHQMLPRLHTFYFTNVRKSPFSKNKYDPQSAEEYTALIEKELEFFNGHKVIFLGKYPVYDKLISKCNVTNYLVTTHPGYFVRFGTDKLSDEQKKINNFCVPTTDLGV